MSNLRKLSIGINVVLGLILSCLVIFIGPPNDPNEWVFPSFVLILTLFNIFPGMIKDTYLGLWVRVLSKRFKEKKKKYKVELEEKE